MPQPPTIDSHPKAVPDLVSDFVRDLKALWWQSEGHMPDLGPTYTDPEQAAREAHLDQFLDVLSREIKRRPRNQSEFSEVQWRILAGFETFGRSALDFEERHVNVLLSPEFTQAVTEFVQAAYHFDPHLSPEAIFQASRNAWVMHGLQILLGLPLQLTPAILAYSLLYPYSDNYVDDPKVSPETKKAFNRRFARRLAGERVVAPNPHEATIYDLVARIEDQYERSTYPQVFQSLLAIQRAQSQSLNLLRQNASPYEVDVLGISLEKGGTSVLADGYLVAGSLDPAQAAFAFGWGAYLQLVDDLQDVHSDQRDGLSTLFAQTAQAWPLDRLTNRAFHFGERIIAQLDRFEGAELTPLKELIRRSGQLLLADAAGSASQFYSKGYIHSLQRLFPFRFSRLNERRQRLGRQRDGLITLLEAAPASDRLESLFPSARKGGMALP